MAAYIHKYPIALQDDYTELQLPRGARPLHFDIQGHQQLFLWVLIDADVDIIRETRLFVIIGTGHRMEAPETLTYIGTAMDPPFVWHLFEFVAGGQGVPA